MFFAEAGVTAYCRTLHRSPDQGFSQTHGPPLTLQLRRPPPRFPARQRIGRPHLRTISSVGVALFPRFWHNRRVAAARGQPYDITRVCATLWEMHPRIQGAGFPGVFIPGCYSSRMARLYGTLGGNRPGAARLGTYPFRLQSGDTAVESHAAWAAPCLSVINTSGVCILATPCVCVFSQKKESQKKKAQESTAMASWR